MNYIKQAVKKLILKQHSTIVIQNEKFSKIGLDHCSDTVVTTRGT